MTRRQHNETLSSRDGSAARNPLVLVSRSQRDDLMVAVPSCPVVVEPSLARAIQQSIDGRAASLWVDLHGFGPQSLTALVQLRLLRPEQQIVLVQRCANPIGLDGTLLEGLPQVWLSIPEVPGHILKMAPMPASAL